MIKFAGTPGKFFYMAINRIHPVGRVQKRIFSMVETLNNTGTELQHIYDTVCSVVPAMADEDMYFLDKMLGIAHLSGATIGECVVCDVRLCLGHDSDDWDEEDGNLVPFSMGERSQLCHDDAISDNKSYMTVAVKFANPLYGVTDTTARFNLFVDMPNADDFFDGRVCKVTLNKDTYTHVEYFPVGDMYLYKGFNISADEHKEIRIRIQKEDEEEIVMQKSIAYMGTDHTFEENFRLLCGYDTIGGTSMHRSTFEVKEELLNAHLNLFLETTYPQEFFPDGKLQLAVRIDVSCGMMPQAVFMKYISLQMDDNGMYCYSGDIFEGLGNLNDYMMLFDSGKYRISFRYMDKELFYTWVYFWEGSMSIESESHPFISVLS